MIKQLLLHGATLYPITTSTDYNEYCSNVGLTAYKDNLIVNIRGITYIPKLWGVSDHNTENYIGIFNEDCNIYTHKLNWKDGGYKIWGRFKGREDMRLVVWNNTLYGYATRTDIKKDKSCIELIEFNDNLDIVKSTFVENIIDVEKNWMAVPDKPFTFVWWNNPITILTVDPITGKYKKTEYNNIGENVSGSTPLMKYNGKYIALVHKSSNIGYQEAFITYSKDLKKAKLGSWFKFQESEIEFVTGMIQYKDNIYISLTLNDIVPLILKIPIDVFDMWYNNTLPFEQCEIEISKNILNSLINNKNYKRALELLSINKHIEFWILFLYLMKNNLYGCFLEYNAIYNYNIQIGKLDDSADKYYLLYIVNKLLGNSCQEFYEKAKKYGVPSLFFNKFFNEHYL